MPNLNTNRYVSDQGEDYRTALDSLQRQINCIDDALRWKGTGRGRVESIKLLLAQLDNTEKAYDRALQMNIDLQDKLDVFESWLPLERDWFDDTLVTAAPDAEAGEEVGVLMGELETMSVPIIPTDPDAEAAVDKAFAEINEAGKAEVQAEAEIVLKRVPPRSEMSAFDQKREWAEGEVREVHGDPEPFPDYSEASLPQVAESLWNQKQSLVRRVREVHGDRAKMKDTLVSTQNACRRYKKRLARQKEQLKVLQELADTGFYVYEKLLRAVTDAEPMSGNSRYKIYLMAVDSKMEQICADFHNKFNEAAEVLSHE